MNYASAFSGNTTKAVMLLVAALSLVLVPVSWASPVARAQEPDVTAAASSVTGGVSGVVTFSSPAENFSGTKTVAFDTVVPIKQTVRISSPGGAFVRLRMTVNLSGTVPINISIGGLPVASSAVMSGTQAVITSQFPVIGTQSRSVTANVTVNGSKKVTVSGSAKDVFVYTIDQSINGTAKMELLVDAGSARLITSEYLPFISRSNVYFIDDFSTDKGWWAIADDDDCEAWVDGGYLKVKVYTEDYDCYISAPDGVFLKQGNFSVEMSRRGGDLTVYGLVFNASTDLDEERWLTQLLPFGGYDCSDDVSADDDEGCLWLSYYNDPDDEEDEWIVATDSANLDKNDWNTLSVKRESNRVRVYVNDAGPKVDKDDDSGLGGYGLFDLKVSAFGDTPVVVYFDNFELTYN